MTAVSVLVPFRPDGAHRDKAWAWLQQRWQDQHPTWEIVVGAAPDGPWCKGAAVVDASKRAVGEVLVVADADVWSDGTTAAVLAVDAGAPWAIPHDRVHRLTEAATSAILAGSPFGDAADADDADVEQRPYRGHEGGGIVVLPAVTLRDVPVDPRYLDWGQEDDSWALALRTLVGAPWRVSAPLLHLWHPPQARQTRRVGSATSKALYARYRRANGNPKAMRALLDEFANARLACEDPGARILRALDSCGPA